MNTYTKIYGNLGYDNTHTIFGKSTDTKPTGRVMCEAFGGEIEITDASTYYEKDTGKWFIYDVETATWAPKVG